MTPRLDAELVRRGLARSRAVAREQVVAGAVLVDGEPASKAAQPVTPASSITVVGEQPGWVGRAAYKLLGALERFGPHGLGVQGARCLDVGASTGGFTQVLLAHGAASVTALDVGHDQLAAPLRDDPRVTDVQGRNIRDVEPGELGEPFDVVVADLSFISLRVALEPMVAQCRDGGELVVLVKPQFEVGRERLARTGVVTSSAERRRVLLDVLGYAVRLGLQVRGLVPSSLPGSDGNQEYLLWVSRRSLPDVRPQTGSPSPAGAAHPAGLQEQAPMDARRANDPLTALVDAVLAESTPSADSAELARSAERSERRDG